MVNVTIFDTSEELEQLTGLTHKELWENGFNLDDWDWGFCLDENAGFPWKFEYLLETIDDLTETIYKDKKYLISYH